MKRRDFVKSAAGILLCGNVLGQESLKTEGYYRDFKNEKVIFSVESHDFPDKVHIDSLFEEFLPLVKKYKGEKFLDITINPQQIMDNNTIGRFIFNKLKNDETVLYYNISMVEKQFYIIYKFRHIKKCGFQTYEDRNKIDICLGGFEKQKHKNIIKDIFSLVSQIMTKNAIKQFN